MVRVAIHGRQPAIPKSDKYRSESYGGNWENGKYNGKGKVKSEMEERKDRNEFVD